MTRSQRFGERIGPINLIEATKQGDLECVREILGSDDKLANQRDALGATPLHYAALNGHRQIAQLLLERGPDINSADSQFGATPAGWAIEYLREMGGHLAIELDDLSYAIQSQDVRWVARFLKRFPSLRKGSDTKGTPFETLARESGNREITISLVRRTRIPLIRPSSPSFGESGLINAMTLSGVTRRRKAVARRGVERRVTADRVIALHVSQPIANGVSSMTRVALRSWQALTVGPPGSADHSPGLVSDGIGKRS
jgi:Ankyrin repeats (3 copies)